MAFGLRLSTSDHLPPAGAVAFVDDDDAKSVLAVVLGQKAGKPRRPRHPARGSGRWAI